MKGLYLIAVALFGLFVVSNATLFSEEIKPDWKIFKANILLNLLRIFFTINTFKNKYRKSTINNMQTNKKKCFVFRYLLRI